VSGIEFWERGVGERQRW